MTQEFLDIVDELDNVISKEPRKTVHASGLWHRGAHVFLFSADGQMLIQQRSADRVHSPSLLDCSVSEHVQAGEDYEQAAIRGIREELGVTDTTLMPLVKFRMNYGPNDNEISVLFKGSVNPGDVQFDPEEIASVGYYSQDELRSMLDNEQDKLCGWFIEILNWHFGLPSKLTVMDNI